jgi:hypothetical protein
VIKTSETQSQTEQPPATSKKTSQKSILALSVFALGLNATAAAYTMLPSDFAWPNVSGLVAELLPHEGASAPIPNAVFAALNDIQSAQQHNATALLDNGFLLQHNAALMHQNGSTLQQNTALLQQDATKLDSLRLSLTEEQSDVKTISAQLSTLIAKVDSLQNAMTSEVTSSIPKGRARARLSGVARKRLARPTKPEGSISVGGAPLTTAPASSMASVTQPSMLKR